MYLRHYVTSRPRGEYLRHYVTSRPRGGYLRHYITSRLRVSYVFESSLAIIRCPFYGVVQSIGVGWGERRSEFYVLNFSLEYCGTSSYYLRIHIECSYPSVQCAAVTTTISPLAPSTRAPPQTKLPLYSNTTYNKRNLGFTRRISSQLGIHE